LKLNLGCGRNPVDGFWNVDSVELPGVDEVVDLDGALPWPDDSVDGSVGIHVLEHLHNPLGFMAELWRVHKADTTVVFHLPYGSSDDAWEDPTHVRPYFLQSFVYFSQAAYWRADYGYTGDWDVDAIRLDVARARYEGAPAEQVMAEVLSLRNVVEQMSVTLRCVKPARVPKRNEIPPRVELNLV
jgi:SAM-dependent methyltransferase